MLIFLNHRYTQITNCRVVKNPSLHRHVFHLLLFNHQGLCAFICQMVFSGFSDVYILFFSTDSLAQRATFSEKNKTFEIFFFMVEENRAESFHHLQSGLTSKSFEFQSFSKQTFNKQL